MTRWGDFNTDGDLPPGIHQATLSQVIDEFGRTTPRRQILAQRLERIFTLAASTRAVARFIIFGSFVTTKPEPGDVDVFLLMEDDFDVRQVSGETALLFDHEAAQNYEGASIFWLRRLAALEGEEAMVAHWQQTRQGTKRGIIEVIGR